MTKVQAIEKISDLFAFRMGGLHYLQNGLDIKYQKSNNSVIVRVYLYPGCRQSVIEFDLQKSKYNTKLSHFLSMHTYIDRHFGDPTLITEDYKWGSYIIADMIMAFTRVDFRNSLTEIMLDYHSIE